MKGKKLLKLGIFLIAVVLFLVITLKEPIKNITKSNLQTSLKDSSESYEANQGYTVTLISGTDLIPDSKEEADMKKNTNSLQTAINQVSEKGGGTVHIPIGTFYFAGAKKNPISGTDSKTEYFLIECKNNVLVEGEGSSKTILKPYGSIYGGQHMFFFNKYKESNWTNPEYLINADFKNFQINSDETDCKNHYTTAGKGFMIALYKNCDWNNVIVKNTDGTGFGMDEPINCTITNCKAYNCGKGATETSDGASGFGIGTGYSNDESIIIKNCYAEGCKKYGFFFEHQGCWSVETSQRFTATKAASLVVSNCEAKNNQYDFGGERAVDVTYENCTSVANSTCKMPIHFTNHSIRVHITNFKSNVSYTDVTNTSSYFYKAVYWLADKGIVEKTTTTFKPNDYCIRGDVIDAIYRMAEMNGDLVFATTNPESGFQDVASDSIYADAVRWAKNNGVTSGVSRTEFAPNRACTWGEFLTFLWRFSGSPEVSGTGSVEYRWSKSVGLISEEHEITDYVTRKNVATVINRYTQLTDISYNIKYNLNAGVETTNPTTYTPGTIITLKNPVKTGYTFNGWTGSNFTSQGKQSTYTPSKTVSIKADDTGYRAYTANWTPNKYTIKFNSNGGTGTMSNEGFTYDNPQLLLPNKFEKVGYTFKGWNTKKAGTGTAYTDNQVVNNLTATNNKSITLYAQWEANTDTPYKVIHRKMNIDGTTYSIAETENLTGTTNASITPSVKEYEGFTSPSVQTTFIAADGSTVVTYDYIRNKYQLTVENIEGATVDGARSGLYYYGEEIELTVNILPGYVFEGWSNGETEENITITIGAGDYTIGPRVVLETYLITYNLDDGLLENQIDEYTVKSEDFYLGIPAKEGYVFVGWTGSNGNTPELDVLIESGSTGDRNYIANWEEGSENIVSYKVEYYKEDLEGNYVLFYSNIYSGIANSMVTLAVPTYRGFISPDAQTVEIKADGSTVVRYYYERDSFEITINCGRGVERVDVTSPAKYGENVVLSPVLKEGYENTIWSGFGSVVFDESTNSFKMPANDLSLTAIATPISYQIQYNLNGGSLEIPNPIEYNIEDDLVLNNPTKNGYTFKGWVENLGDEPQLTMRIVDSTGEKSFIAIFESDSSTNYTVKHWKQKIDGDPLEKDSYNYEEVVTDRQVLTGPTENIVIPDVKTYPGFTSPEPQPIEITADGKAEVNYYYTRNKYSVTIPDVNGVEVEGAEEGEYYYEQEITLEAIVSDGYKFEGWSNGETDNPITIVISDSNVEISPIISLINYTITYNLDGGEITGEKTSYNVETPTFTLVEPTKEGHTFIGWTGSNGSVPNTFVRIRKGTIGNKSYTANWRVNIYTIVFTETDEVWEIEYGEPLGSIPFPDKIGYIFTGWYTDPIGGEKVDRDTIVRGDATYYPHWELIQVPANEVCTITFDGNGGTDGGTRKVYSGSKVGILPKSLKNRCDFLGWYTQPENGERVTEDTIVNSDVTYYAQWLEPETEPEMANYTVRHYLMDIDEIDCTLVDEEILTGEVGTQVTPEVKAYPGFTSPKSKTLTIAANGKSLINYVYDRNKYLVELTGDEGIEELIGGGEYYYEEEVTIKATLKDGYQWGEWLCTENEEDDSLIPSQEYKFTLGTKNTSFKAISLKNAKVIVKYINKDTGEEITSSEEINGFVDKEYEINPLNIEGYTFAYSTENAKGNMTEEDIIVEMYYTVNKPTEIIAKYVDINSNEEISENKVITDEEEAENIDIDKYSFVEKRINSEENEIVYYYVKNCVVEVKYIDLDTNKELKPSAKLNGKETEDYDATNMKENIEGYTLEEIPENIKGKYKNFEDEVVFGYKKVKAQEPEKEHVNKDDLKDNDNNQNNGNTGVLDNGSTSNGKTQGTNNPNTRKW